jgi:predicted nucleotidyltransferase
VADTMPAEDTRAARDAQRNGGEPGEFEKEEVDQETFLRILDESVEAMERGQVPYVFIGSIPSVLLGRPRWTDATEDIDYFVKREDARRALDALEDGGFATEETNGQWLFKGKKDGVVVDVIFRSTGDIYLSEEMLERATKGEFKGRTVRLAPPEDLLVMKAVAHGQDTQTYWHDALGILARGDLDWDYLLSRATQHGARRILSLLIYGESNDLVVPTQVIQKLVKTIYGG